MAEKEKVDLKELSKSTRIPVKVLQHMISDGAFTEYMDNMDQEFIFRLLAILDKHYFIRHCMLRIRSNRRDAFIETAALDTRWERYIYTNMANHFALGGKISIPEFVKHAEEVFKFTFTPEHVERVKQIRDAIYKKQSRHKRKKQKEIVGQIAP